MPNVQFRRHFGLYNNGWKESYRNKPFGVFYGISAADSNKATNTEVSIITCHNLGLWVCPEHCVQRR